MTMTRKRRLLACSCLLPALLFAPLAPARAELTKTIPLVKRSVVGIGTELRTRSPAIAFFGTGFVVGDGRSVVTNAHVVPPASDGAGKETLGIVMRERNGVAFRPARLVAIDREHDLAHLRIEGEALPVLQLGEPEQVVEGAALAFTGFPLGMVLGLHPATHRATLAAITPIVMPSLSSRKLDARAITQLARSGFDIYQLDGTAYPGNSGSPVYDPDTGVVQAVINMVFVKGLKETAISAPSGITYAIPVRYVHALLQQK
ncbi:S1 family peptidase [Massilia sp. BKSP1R2A-1]|uniref:S1 family peptidase n=1 Tax=Massilia sp. BKSP1R2A-1 TaxID=3422595 RepID=UPI003D3372DE